MVINERITILDVGSAQVKAKKPYPFRKILEIQYKIFHLNVFTVISNYNINEIR